MTYKKSLIAQLDRYKYPFIVLVIGLLLLMLPGNDGYEEKGQGKDELLRNVLSETVGVGEIRVISSDNGVVVVCQGAENAKVRLDIIRAVGSYTGFASDKITILKMTE